MSRRTIGVAATATATATATASSRTPRTQVPRPASRDANASESGLDRRYKPDRKQAYVETALELIATHGIAALSTRSLAEAVGVSTGAMFRHFASIEALLEAIAEHVEQVLDDTYPDAGLPPAQRLHMFVENRTAAVQLRRGIVRLVVSEQFTLALPEPATQRLRRSVRKTQAFLLACLEEGQAARVIRDDVAAPALVAIVMGTIQFLAVGSVLRDQASEVRHALMKVLGKR